MPTWIVVLLVLALFMLARGVAMLYLKVRVNRAHSLLNRYWSDEVDYGEIAFRKRDITRLLRAAHVSSPRVPRVEPLGYGQILSGNFVVFDNMFKKDVDIAMLMRDALLEAEGYYRSEARRSLVPIFWPSVLAHLPSDLLVYIGVSPESAATRAATAIGWLATVAAATVGVINLIRAL